MTKKIIGDMFVEGSDDSTEVIVSVDVTDDVVVLSYETSKIAFSVRDLISAIIEELVK